MTRILIVDGVTGAGKSSVLRELRDRMQNTSMGAVTEFVFEEETLGQIMDQVRDPTWQASPTFDALDAVMARIEAELAAVPSRRFVLERFHLTAYALFPQWRHIKRFDTRLAQLGAHQVLLSYPDEFAERRAIERADRSDQGWAQGMAEWYGSRQSAVDAVIRSQRRRWEGLRKSALPFLHLDTREGNWPRYAESILAFWAGCVPSQDPMSRR